MKKLDHVHTSGEQPMPLFSPPNTFRDIVDTDPDQCLFSNNRTGPRERETQPIPPSAHVKESFKGGLCERREEFNEARG